MKSELNDEKISENLLTCLGCSYPLQPQNKSVSSSDIEYENWPIELLPPSTICSTCLNAKKDYEAEKSQKEISLLEKTLKSVNENTLEEIQKDRQNKALPLKMQILETQHQERLKKIKEEKAEVAKLIISELAEIEELNDKIHEFGFEGYGIYDDIYKYLNEMNIVKLESEELTKFNPILETFNIEIFDDYGSIRQYPIKIYLKSENLPQTWKAINEGLGAIAWMLDYLMIEFKITSAHKIHVLGPLSEIKTSSTVYRLYGPVADSKIEGLFNKGLEILLDLTKTIYIEVVHKLSQLNKLPKEFKLPHKIEKEYIGGLKLVYVKNGRSNWELAMRNLLIDLKFIGELIGNS